MKKYKNFYKTIISIISFLCLEILLTGCTLSPLKNNSENISPYPQGDFIEYENIKVASNKDDVLDNNIELPNEAKELLNKNMKELYLKGSLITPNRRFIGLKKF